MLKMRNVKGRLTTYSFMCGYIEQKSTDPFMGRFRKLDLYTELWYKDEVYHVRQIDYRDNGIPRRVFWESFAKIQDARSLFNRQPGRLVNVIDGRPLVGIGPKLARHGQ